MFVAYDTRQRAAQSLSEFATRRTRLDSKRLKRPLWCYGPLCRSEPFGHVVEMQESDDDSRRFAKLNKFMVIL